jgi:transcriptional regulator with XRE-family HTH domain
MLPLITVAWMMYLFFYNFLNIYYQYRIDVFSRYHCQIYFGVKMSRIMPHYCHKKEYESNLSEFRIQAGLTIKELCKKVNISPTEYTYLNSGLTAPLTYTGTTKDSVIRLAEFFNAELSDLFPRYFCTLSKLDNYSIDEIVDNFHPEKRSPDFDDPELLLLRKELVSAFDRLLNGLSRVDKFVIIEYFIKDETVTKISKDLNVSQKTGRILLDKALKNLRRRTTKLVKQDNHMFEKFNKSNQTTLCK